MKAWLKNAFAVENPEGVEPTAVQKEIVDKVCREVARRHMSTPALLFLETFHPLNYIGSQVLHFFQPIVAVILTTDSYGHFAEFLEQRSSIDYLCRKIEYYEANTSEKDNSVASPAMESKLEPNPDKPEKMATKAQKHKE